MKKTFFIILSAMVLIITGIFLYTNFLKSQTSYPTSRYYTINKEEKKLSVYIEKSICTKIDFKPHIKINNFILTNIDIYTDAEFGTTCPFKLNTAKKDINLNSNSLIYKVYLNGEPLTIQK